MLTTTPKTLLLSIVALSLASACGDVALPAAPAARPIRVLYEFEGVVENGDVTIRKVRALDKNGNGDLDGSANSVEQPLQAIREDKGPGIGIAAEQDGIEFVIERTNATVTSPYPNPVVVPAACGVNNAGFEFNVTVRNFFPTDLNNVFAEITQITPNAPTNHAICNSDRETPNLFVDDTSPPTRLSATLGLIRYGHLEADTNGAGSAPSGGTVAPPLGGDLTAQTMLWRFQAGAPPFESFSFKGRVYADICNDADECTPGVISNEGPLVPIANASAFGETNGTVEAVLEGNGLVYVGGSFTAVGPRTGAAFATLPTTGTAQTPWAPFVGGEVNAFTPDGFGGFYAGGTFQQVGNESRPRLVHILNTGEIDDAFQPSTALTSNGAILALHYDVDNEVLWVGRSVTPFLAAIKNTTGNAFAAPGPVLPAINDQVMAIAAAGDFVVIGGEFTNVGGAPNLRDKVAVFARNGALQPFALPIVGDANLSVDSLFTDGTTVWIGGEFTTIAATPTTPTPTTRNRLAAADLATGVLHPWAPNVENNSVRAIQIAVGAGGPGVDVAFIGGTFTSMTDPATALSVPRLRLAAVDATVSVAAPALRAFEPRPSNTVNALLVDDGVLYVGGTFTFLNGGTLARPSRLVAYATDPDVASPVPTSWNPITRASTGNITVRAIVFDSADGELLIGGVMTNGGMTPRSNLAAFDLETGQVATFSADTNNTVRALAVSGSSLYVGGIFTTIGGLSRTNLAAVDAGDGTPISTFLAQTNNAVEALAVSPSHVYFGGTFTSVGLAGGGAASQARLARVPLSGASVDLGWIANVNSTVFALAVDGDVWAGGQFTTLGGAPVNRMVRLSSVNGALIADYGVTDNQVRALAVSRGIVYGGGSFTSPSSGVIAFETRNNAPLPGFSAAADGTIESIAAAGSSVVVGGSFTQIDGAPRVLFAVIDARTGNAFPSAPLINGTRVSAVAIIGRHFVGGGNFANAPVATVGTTVSSVRSNVVVVNGD